MRIEWPRSRVNEMERRVENEERKKKNENHSLKFMYDSCKVCGLDCAPYIRHTQHRRKKKTNKRWKNLWPH